MALDWSKCAEVESVPGKVSGAWIFRGTRTPVKAVFENLGDGLSIDAIVEMFDGLTREHVRTCAGVERLLIKVCAPETEQRGRPF